jgi:hypothetical protein
MGISLKLFSKGRKIWQVSWSLFHRTSITEKRFFDALIVPAFRQRPVDHSGLWKTFWGAQSTDHDHPGIGDLDRPESLITIVRNPQQATVFGTIGSIVDDLTRLSGSVTTYSSLGIANGATVSVPNKSAGRK